MEVVPGHPEVEIEHVPADPLPGVREDRRGVANERATVETEGRQVVTATLDNAVLAGATVRPGNLPVDPDGHIRRVERDIDDRDGGCARPARLQGARAGEGSASDMIGVALGDGLYKLRGLIHAAVLEC